ncbi:ribonuclease H-like domain-containing protein [Apodospora peruviana]|uniref:Ribonuclease H n=1 Tax=Apodospora peruviana TaxID=516989 RepID=A0AAE0I1I4_9PEZI|nr:ribonuclease H-like domain-containing protein [Apodospora peruviana]
MTKAGGPPSKKRKMGADETKYYAVRAGYKPGVYMDWKLCQQQISGFKGAQFKSFLSREDASAFVAGRDPPSRGDGDKPERFYGVAIGRTPGVYTDWSKASEAIVGWKGPKYKRFETRAEAEAFVRTYGNNNSNTTPAKFAPLEISDDEDEEEELQVVQAPPAKKAKVTAKIHSVTATSRAEEVDIVYTDGSALGNGKRGAMAGVGVYFGEGDPRNISERLEGMPQTNQRAELMAILRTFEVLGDDKSCEIRSDSKYAIQCVTEWFQSWERNNWMTRNGDVQNQDIIRPIINRLRAREAKGTKTQFIWVKGHASDSGNIAADLLAVAGARKAMPA